MLRDRYRRITSFFARVILTIGFWDLFLPRIGLRSIVESTRAERMRRIAVRFRKLAIEMGGVMIKVGQFLSTRVDVLPLEITNELSGLQDEVPPEPFEAIRRVAENDLGMSLEQCFARFEPQAIAAASLGQVHQAALWPSSANGDDKTQNSIDSLTVVVKIQRPKIELIIATDLAALRTVGLWLQRYPPIRRRANVPALLEEFSRILNEEIDYLAEGRNVETFAEHFKTTSGVCVPRVIWSHTTQRVLTLEDVRGIKIDDYTAITETGIDRHEVAERLLEIYFKQIFEDGFFHADPHPGNLFVNRIIDVDNNVNWILILVDFGMVGHIAPNTRQGLREMLIAFGTRDSSRLIRAYQQLGVLLPGADLALLEKANTRSFELFWGKNMAELKGISHDEMRQLVLEFRELVFDLPFQVPQDLIFLARAVGLLSGLCTGLDPQFNVWEQLAPYAKRLLAQDMKGSFIAGLPEGISDWLVQFSGLIQRMIALPGRTEALLARVEKGELEVRDQQLAEQVRRLSVTLKHLAGGIIVASLVVTSAQLALGGFTLLAAGLGIAALIILIWIMVSR